MVSGQAFSEALSARVAEDRINGICQHALNRKPVMIMDLPKIYKVAKENAHHDNDTLLQIVTDFIEKIRVKS